MGLPLCIFCKKGNRRTASEDIFPKWMAREFGKYLPKKAFFNYSSEDPRRPKFKKRSNSGSFEVLSKAPCEECNHGWMSDLETNVKAFVTPMMFGKSISLAPDAQITIAEWFLKTVMVYEYEMHHGPKSTRRYFKPVDRYAFYKDRLIPGNTQIFLARVRSKAHLDSGIDGIYIQPRPALTVFKHNSDDLLEVESYCVTFRINQLALQIFTFRDLKEFNGGNYRLSFRTGLDWTSARARIWPLSGSRDWPPPKAIGPDLIPKFEDCWHDALQKSTLSFETHI
jgi:hypothetical protein